MKFLLDFLSVKKNNGVLRFSLSSGRFFIPGVANMATGFLFDRYLSIFI